MILYRIRLRYIWLSIFLNYLMSCLLSARPTIKIYIHVFRLREIEIDPQLIIITFHFFNLIVCEDFVNLYLVKACIILPSIFIALDVAKTFLFECSLSPSGVKGHIESVLVLAYTTHTLIRHRTVGKHKVIARAG